jgi:UTP--glucose-1-phosphate uridylyltransferase
MISNRCFSVNNLIEKPAKEKAPSNLAVLGRNILIPEIFPILISIPSGQEEKYN